MASAQPKIVLSQSQDIPFNKLVLSQANVRRVKAGQSVEELAADIARRGLLQSLNVRPVRDAEGAETGLYEIPAGGRRYRALELLVKQRRLSKTQPIPCVVRDDGLAEEDSLAENVQRVALHPLDQFRAFQSLRATGMSEEDIAARFFVTPAVVAQRLKLAAVSPKLLDAYAEEEMNLEQLMAFTVTADHDRQERVWEAARRSPLKSAYAIRQQLTTDAVRACDRRASFLGLEAYEAAGGVVMRDLFTEDGGGWLEDTALVERLCLEKLTAAAEAIRAEGWKWIEVAIEFPYGHAARMRRLPGQVVGLTEDEQARLDAARAEYDRLEDRYADADELPQEVERRLGELEGELEGFEDRPLIYDEAGRTRAGVLVSIDVDGSLRVERGYVRPEDELPRGGADTVEGEDGQPPEGEPGHEPGATTITVAGADGEDAPDEDDGLKPLSERLVMELTAHRTLALREALSRDAGIAFVAVLHVLALAAFYRYAASSCLEITAKSASFAVQAPGLADTASAKAIEAEHEAWLRRLPEDPEALWDALLALDAISRERLFAHCAALTVNVVREAWNRRQAALINGDRLARAIGLDMAAAGWTPTVANYLGRVPKARILEAVSEAKGEAAAHLIDHLKKPEMAKEAERLLADTGWLPEPLRLSEGSDGGAETDAEESQRAAGLPAFLDEGEAPAEPLAAAAA